MDDQSDVESMDVSDEVEETDETVEETDEIVEETDESSEPQPVKRKVYLPGHSLKDGEVLEPDSSAYIMLHAASAGKSFCYIFVILSRKYE